MDYSAAIVGVGSSNESPADDAGLPISVEADPKSLHMNRADFQPFDGQQISIEFGIITDSTRIPQFAVRSRRQATFLTWPSTNNKLASEMIEHFLYYTGTSDTVSCYYCGVEMSKWTSIESIWVRHARQSSTCQLLLREQGQDFVASVILDHGRYQEPPIEPTINVVTTRMLRPRMDSPVAQGVLQLSDPDYSRDDVRNALINNIKYGRPDFKTLAELVRAIQTMKKEQRDPDRVREDIEQEPAAPEVPAINVVTTRKLRPRWDRDEIERALQLPGCSRDDIKKAVINRMKCGEPDSKIVVEVVRAIGAMKEEQRDLDTVREDIEQEPAPPEESAISNSAALIRVEATNEEVEEAEGYEEAPPVGVDPRALAAVIKSQLKCKVCLDAVVGIMFLPCGHLVCCTACACFMIQCPLCRNAINGTIKMRICDSYPVGG